MINIKSIVKGFLILSFLAVAVIATRVEANNDNVNSNGFLNAQASLKADALIRLENSVGVALGSNGALRVLGAKVTSVSGSDISATAEVGNSSLNFVVKTDANTKLNGKLVTNASAWNDLKAGDKISFAGTITSSTSSSIVVDGDHVVSRALFDKNNGKTEDKASFQGEVTAVNTADNSFTLKLKNGVVVKVVVSSGAVITINGEVKTIASLQAGDETKVTGQLNAEGTVITASKITVGDNDKNDNNGNDDHSNKNDDNKDNKSGGFWGKIKHWFWK